MCNLPYHFLLVKKYSKVSNLISNPTNPRLDPSPKVPARWYPCARSWALRCSSLGMRRIPTGLGLEIFFEKTHMVFFLLGVFLKEKLLHVYIYI